MSNAAGPRWRATVGMLVLGATALALAAAFTLRWYSRPSDDLAARSPYRNARPGVEFIGDAACARCHPDVAATYRLHPMGRSIARAADVPIPGDGVVPASFRAQGLEYSVERRGAKVIHKEVRKDATGKVVAASEGEARFAIGSGEQAVGYLIDRGGGYLFESPITWYSRKNAWDLSPGYEKDNLHFERFVKPVCLFCHANRFEHVAGSENRYREPVFRGHAIGCERCHGPGALHAAHPEPRAGAAPDIVNPSKLEPSLRESVCQQCHLQGDIRVVHPGRELTSFRPGLPLSKFETVFVRSSTAGKTRFFGQVEQMYESRCFRESQGKMGCVSCHDPHELPAPAEAKDYYKERCLDCHAEKGCAVPRETRLAKSRGDYCTECHMPRSSNEQVAHAATTLHLIPRFADRVETPSVSSEVVSGVVELLVPFHRDEISLSEQAVVARDLGIALTEKSHAFPEVRPSDICRRALPMLEAALAADPSDVPAWHARGQALWQLERREEALDSFRKALKLAPRREETLVHAATRLSQLGRREEALDGWKRVLAINPWRADYHQVLGMLHVKNKDWEDAAAESRAAVRLNPTNIEARLMLVDCLLRTSKLDEARAEFATVLAFDPPNRSALERWFAASRTR